MRVLSPVGEIISKWLYSGFMLYFVCLLSSIIELLLWLLASNSGLAFVWGALLKWACLYGGLWSIMAWIRPGIQLIKKWIQSGIQLIKKMDPAQKLIKTNDPVWDPARKKCVTCHCVRHLTELPTTGSLPERPATTTNMLQPAERSNDTSRRLSCPTMVLIPDESLHGL